MIMELFLSLIFAADKVHYPMVSELQGKILIADKTNKIHSPLKKEILHEKVRIETSGKSQIKVELDADTTLLLLENSQLEIPVISWEDGSVSEVILKKGNLRVNTKSKQQRYYSTEISHDVYSEADFLLSYQPESALLKLTVFSGALDFRGLNAELSARVGSGETAHFQGVVEAGEPSFDVLLKGKKIARGNLSAVEKLKAEEIETYSKQSSIQVVKEIKTVIKLPRLPEQICDNPYGKLDECVWQCEKFLKKICKKCVRRRCDANGKWQDAFVYPDAQGEMCEKSAQVKSCDY